MKIILGLIFFNVINIPVYLFLLRKFFDTMNDFCDALKFSFQPDIISAFRGEFWEDKRQEIKLAAFIILCGALLIGEFVLLGLVVDWRSAIE
jgi:hypothetical protein